MLPAIPYCGVLRPLLMLLCTIAAFALVCSPRLRAKRRVQRMLLSSYFLLLLYATLLSRTPDAHRPIILTPLTTLSAALKARGADAKPLREAVYINLLLLLPLGFLLPSLMKLSGWVTLLSAFCISALIEGAQGLLGLGMLDVDDLLLNTLGAGLGLLLWYAVGRRSRGKPC